jgi:hypothetical protein
MRADIGTNVRMHNILPLFDMLHTDRVGERRYFDEEGNLTHSFESRRGVRQGSVLGLFIFCVTMALIYVAFKAELGPEGMLVAFSDDMYFHGPPPYVASAISAAPALYKKVGGLIRIGWGLIQFELALSVDVDPDTLDLPRGENGRILPHLVRGLEACLGIPRHMGMCMDFISGAMKKPVARHDRLLQLVMDIAEEAPLTALRLLHVRGVNWFGHVIYVVPPCIIRPCAVARDAAVVSCLESIQQHEVGPHSSHALLVGAGGAALHSLQRHGSGTHLGTYYRIAEPLIARLLMMGGLKPRKAAEQLINPTAALACNGGGGGVARRVHEGGGMGVSSTPGTRRSCGLARVVYPGGARYGLPSHAPWTCHYAS